MNNYRCFSTVKIIFFLILTVLLAGCTHSIQDLTHKTVSVSRSAVEMGTVVSQTLYTQKRNSSDAESVGQLSQKADEYFRIIDELDQKILSWRSDNSEVSQFNRCNAMEGFTISRELADVIQQSFEMSRQSCSALDITLRNVIDLWGIESHDGMSDYRPPDESSIEKAAGSVGIEHVIINKKADGSILLSKDISSLGLDLGAVGKGYALDVLASELTASEIRGAVIAVGGSILAYGDKGDLWQIGLRDPKGSPNDYLGILSFSGGDRQTSFISTSGGYEKYVEYEGKKLEHIIDGRSLHPAESDLYSVTIVTKDSGLISDGLSTACYILGIDESKPLLDVYHADAVFVTRDNKIYLTDGLKEMFSLSNMAYSVLEMP